MSQPSTKLLRAWSTEKRNVMFTLEESELLSRMLRFVGWAVFSIALAAVAYLAVR